MEKKLSRSSVVEARLDVRTLATLLRYYVDAGSNETTDYSVSSLGDLVHTGLEDFVNVLCASMTKQKVPVPLAVRFTEITTAKQYLEEVLGKSTHRKGERSLIRAIQLETLEREGASIGQVNAPTTKKIKEQLLKGGSSEHKQAARKDDKPTRGAEDIKER